MITVFTPTFNRGYIIGNLFDSLKNQTNKNFEWIVIDDGSEDNTLDIFEGILKEECEFPITYRKVENGGKHRAINKAVQMAAYDAFFIVDSDDSLLPDAIEKVDKWFSFISGDPRFAGVAGLKGFTADDPVGGYGAFEGEYIDATNLERDKYNLNLDKAEVYKTEILKKYQFPEFEGENFLTEAVVWNKIAKAGYLIRWYNEVIYLCDYLEDGLSKNANSRIMDNPIGYSYHLAVLESVYGADVVDAHRLKFYQMLLQKYDSETTFKIINIANGMKNNDC